MKHIIAQYLKDKTLFSSILIAVFLVSAVVPLPAMAQPVGKVQVMGNQIVSLNTNVDLSTDGVERLSLDGSGVESNGISVYPSLSSNGRYVAFSSSASNLVANDANGLEDVFVRDRQSGAVTRVSVGVGGQESDGFSSIPSISPDGRYIGFASNASNLVAGDTNNTTDAFLYDRQIGQMVRMSTDGNDQSNRPVVSPDGNYWVFASWANNLVAGDANDVSDVFLYDQSSGTLTRVSVDDNGIQGNADSTTAAVSAGGRYVVFRSVASNLVSADTNGMADIFRYDTQTGTVTLISVGDNGQPANDGSDRPVISGDGRYVVFSSAASNLVANDTNGVADIFVRDTVQNATLRVSTAANGQEGNAASSYPAISVDGRYVEFASSASNLVSGDTNGVDDIFLVDLQSGQLRRMSVDGTGAQGNGASNSRATFAAGQPYLAFSSSASNLVPADQNGVADVFAVDFVRMLAMQTPSVTPTLTAVPATNTPEPSSTFTNVPGPTHTPVPSATPVPTQPSSPTATATLTSIPFISPTPGVTPVSAIVCGYVAEGVTCANRGSYIVYTFNTLDTGWGPYVPGTFYTPLGANKVGYYTDLSQHETSIYEANTIQGVLGICGFDSGCRLKGYGPSGQGKDIFAPIIQSEEFDLGLIAGYPHTLRFNIGVDRPAKIYLSGKVYVYAPGACRLLETIVDPVESNAWIEVNPFLSCMGGPGTSSETTDITAILHMPEHSPYAFVNWSGQNVSIGNPAALATNLRLHAGGFASITAHLVPKPPLLLVHGYEGFVLENDLTQHPPFDCSLGGSVMRYFDRSPHDDFSMGTLPQAFADKYDVWLGYWTTGVIRTTSLGSNGRCMQREIDQVYADSHQQRVTVVTHSTGAPVNRYCLSSLNCKDKVRALYTLGGANAGFNSVTIALLSVLQGAPAGSTISDVYCRLQEAVCEMTALNMAAEFNPHNHNQPGIKYVFIGGDAPGTDIFSGSSGLITRLEGPNDGFPGRANAVGWTYNPLSQQIGGFSPPDWAAASPPAQLWTHEVHIPSFRSAANPLTYLQAESISFHCIMWQEGHEATRPAGCQDADISAGSSSIVHLAQLAPPVGPNLLPGVHGHLNPGDPEITQQLPIDGGGPVSFLVSWGAGELNISLSAPDGTLITPAYAAAHPEVVTLESTPATSAMPAVTVYTFPQPAPGWWFLHIVPGALDNAGTNFSTMTMLQSARLLEVSADADTYHPGDAALLTTTLHDSSGGLDGALVTGTFGRADGVTDNVAFSGQGNGVYTAAYTVPASTGITFMEITASGDAAGVPFVRRQLLALAIVSPAVTLDGTYSDAPYDADGNGRYDSLQVQVGVQAVQAGNFRVSGDLMVGSQLVAHGATDAELTAGGNTITLAFSGDDIRNAQLNGPYTLTHLAILDSAQADLPTDQKDNVWQTAAYNWHDLGVCFALTTAVEPASGGIVVVNPEPDCGASQYTAGTDVTLSAVAYPNDIFTGWAGDQAGTSASLTVTMNRDLNIKAVFNQALQTITGNVGVSGAILNYDNNGSQSVTAAADGNYSISVPYGWSGVVVPSLAGHAFAPASRSYTNLTGDLAGEDYSLLVDTPTPTPTPVFASTATVERVNLDSNALEGNNAGNYPSLSADGRYATFSSAANNLVASDTNDVEDIFLRDRYLGTTTRISAGLSGSESNGFSSIPSISPDGRYVGFTSDASNLVANDTNGVADAFLYDRQTGQTIRLSVNGNGEEGSDLSNRPAVSPDGNFWVFASWANNLVPGDTNNLADVFVYNHSLGTLTRISVGNGGVEGDGDSTTAVVSDGGRYVVFKSLADNLVAGDTNGKADIFRYDTQAGTMARVSIDSAGLQANGDSDRPSISADGRYILFSTTASNLDANDTDGVADIFVRDVVLNITSRVSLADNGQQGNAASSYPAISADGRYVEFASSASNLVPGDTNGKDDIFLRDLQSGIIRRLSVDATGAQSNGDSNGRAMFAADRPYLAYVSTANNLVPNDQNSVADIFVVDWSVVMSWTSPTSTPAPTVTPTLTNTATATAISTPTITQTPTITATPTIMPTASKTFTPTVTATITRTPTKTVTPTITRTSTRTPTVTRTSTSTSTITPTPTPVTVTFTSTAAEDGWVLESAAGSGLGGSINSANTTFLLGNNTANKKYKSILSFNTASLPDTAVISSVAVFISPSGLPGHNLGNLYVDIHNGPFGTSTLQTTDFQAAPSASRVATLVQIPDIGINPPPYAGWYAGSLSSTGISNVGLIGLTQLRLYFELEDNMGSKNFPWAFYSGNAVAADRPFLQITYTLP